MFNSAHIHISLSAKDAVYGYRLVTLSSSIDQTKVADIAIAHTHTRARARAHTHTHARTHALMHARTHTHYGTKHSFVHLTSYVQERHTAISAPFSRQRVTTPASGPCTFDQVVFNDGNNYDPSLGVYTAPFSGVDLFSLQLHTISPLFFCTPNLVMNLMTQM